MKILVTGANGMLGQDLCPILEQNGYEVQRTDINNLDITNLDNVRSEIEKSNPDIVVHCAAYTNVDKAEENIQTARLVNAKGTENIARICSERDVTVLYISTDYVFDGNGDLPYNPADKTAPLNNYGLTKLEGEQAIQKYCKKYYICRTSWLYGIHGKNFVETMLALAGVEPESGCDSKPSRAEHNNAAVVTEATAQGTEQSLIAQAEQALAGVEPESGCDSKPSRVNEIKVVDDQIGCPTWTVDLSNAIIKIIKDKPYGIYHTCGSGSTSWYSFAKKIFNLAGVKANLKPCTTLDFPRPAKRPKYSVMQNDGICENWEDAISNYMKIYHSTL